MIKQREEMYLTGTEVAQRLNISKSTFYRRYRSSLQEYKVGKLKRIHYSLSEVEQLNSIELVVRPTDASQENEHRRAASTA